MNSKWVWAVSTLLISTSSHGQMSFPGVQATLDSYLGSSSSSVWGYSFALTESDQSTFWTAANGNLNTNSVVALASVSKVVSAIAILTLVDAQKLDLDEPVGTYFKRYDPLFYWPADKQTITMRMLLSHTAGIPSPPDPETGFCLNIKVSTLRACAQYIANGGLDFTPGTTFSYTGADYQIAGYIATLISRKSWQSFFAHAVASPMKLTTFSYGNSSNPRIGGDGQCNTADYAKILRMILRNGLADNNQRILSPGLISVLETNQTAGLVINPLPSLFFSGGANLQSEFSGYTFGFFIINDSVTLPTGSPGPVFADPGATGAVSWIDAGLQYGGILLIQSNTTTGLDMTQSVMPAIVTDLN